jgi:hypothetical protein
MTTAYNTENVFNFLFNPDYKTKLTDKELIKKELNKLQIGVIIPLINNVDATQVSINKFELDKSAENKCVVSTELASKINYTINKLEDNKLITFSIENNAQLFTNDNFKTFMGDINSLIDNLTKKSDNFFQGGNNKSHTKKYRNRNHSKSRKTRV